MLQKAFALHQKGQLAEAAALYRKILRRDPKNADAFHLLAVLEMQRKNAPAAIELFDRAIELGSKSAALFSNRGAALKALKRLDEALLSFNRALAIKPDYAEALNNRGFVLQELKQPDEALASLNRALALRPDYAEALNNRGMVLRDLKRLDEALVSFNRAIAVKPDYAEAMNNRGTVLRDLNRLDQALASFSRAIAIKPDYVEALTNRGVVLKELRRIDEALASYDRALATKPDHADAHYNRGIVLQDLKRPEEALASYDRAVELMSDRADTLYNRSLIHLLGGDYRKGFAGYEWRWQTKDFSSKAPALAAPKWQGEDLAGRSILVFTEQGLGDTIQFARYLPLLLGHGAKVTFFCPAKLHRLLRPVCSGIEVVASLAGEERFDFQCALMSLPMRLGTDLDSIPNDVPYLYPEADVAGEWKQRVGEAGFKIGITWRGNPDARIDRDRSVPLSEFVPLARKPGARVISLQKNFGLDQLRNLPPGVTVETLGDGFDNGPDAFIDTAAVMSNLDLIVTVDTSIAHVAGALGRPTWVALQRVPDWRWLLDRGDSPWYPTIRLFRQQTRDDWSTVFRDIALELDAVLSKRGA